MGIFLHGFQHVAAVAGSDVHHVNILPRTRQRVHGMMQQLLDGLRWRMPRRTDRIQVVAVDEAPESPRPVAWLR